MVPNKACLRFDFIPPPSEGMMHHAAPSVFVWPDEDRTVVFDDHRGTDPERRGRRLDSVRTRRECISSLATGRNFCYGLKLGEVLTASHQRIV